MCPAKVDAVVVGAGIAGLGVAAQLARRGLKVVCFEKAPCLGGRLRSFVHEGGWSVDIGLHMTELGGLGAASELARRVGGTIDWPPFSESVQFYDQGAWKDIAELVQLSGEDRRGFQQLLGEIALLADDQIAAVDDVSWEEWLVRRDLSEPLQGLLTILSMIMTTLPLASEQAAGEVLFICRENLRKRRQVLSANYPIGGMAAITRPLQEAIEAAGNEIVVDCEVQEIVIEKGAVRGVRIPRGDARSPYPEEYRVAETETVKADLVVCTVPTYQVHRILDLNPGRTALPAGWVRWVRQNASEITGLIGFVLGLKAPVTDKRCFYSALRLPHSGLAFQAFPASNYDPGVAPPGKQLLHTDCVIDYKGVTDPFTVRHKLEAMRKDLSILFPGIEDQIEWCLPYKTVGCDGIARKPGLVGDFKPDVEAPGIHGLYFAGDTYRGRGLAMNGAARSAMLCADRILQRLA